MGVCAKPGVRRNTSEFCGVPFAAGRLQRMVWSIFARVVFIRGRTREPSPGTLQRLCREGRWKRFFEGADHPITVPRFLPRSSENGAKRV